MPTRTYTLADVRKALDGHHFSVAGNESQVKVRQARTLEEATGDSLAWISSSGRVNADVWQTSACLIVCQPQIEIPEAVLQEKCVLKTENPKLLFSVLVTALFVKKPSHEVHATAYVHPEADLASDVYVGPFSYVGRCKVGAGSIIWGHCYLYDDVIIGRNVEIHAGCIIGDDGSGYAKNEVGEWIKFPHIGQTIIEDHVEIGANTYVNKGALGRTLIKRGAKIGNSVCIGHNVVVEENAIVIANSLACGSSVVGKGAYIAPSVTIRNRRRVGDHATVGLGAVVTRDVPDGTTVIGNPAVSMAEYRTWSSLKKKLSKMFGKDAKDG